MENLDSKQLSAMAVLMRGGTRAEAAETAGVSESTVYRWLDDEAFRVRLKDAQRRVFDEATASLYGLTTEAVDALRRGLNSGESSIEVRTAIAVLSQATRLREIELVDRIERLEKLLEERAEDIWH